ncbi:MAG: hypothetical protein HY482_01300 [Candidatus Wildermuthbacteria bacterium]|nr:hypothetical protein [Candidatus Wildermuthbacteria bacterium]
MAIPKTVQSGNQEGELFRLGQLRYSLFVVILTGLSAPLLYFFLEFPWATNRTGAVLSLFVLFCYIIFARYAVKGRWVRAVVVADHFVTVACVASLAYFTGGALSPFNFFLIIPIAFGSFLAGRKFGIAMMGISLGVLASFLFLPGTAGAEFSIRLAFVLSYGVLILYLSYVLLFLREMLVRLDRARKIAQERVSYLEHVTARLKELDEVKSEFITRTSHQLLSPLNRISWVLGSVLEGQFGQAQIEQKARVEVAQKSAKDLIKLATDLLDLGKIEEGVRGAKRERVVLADVVSRALKDQEEAIRAKRLEVSVKDGKQTAVVSDVSLLSSAIGHVIDNAVRYNKKGGKVAVDILEKEEMAVMKVSDTGIGISEQDMPNVFKRFYRGENASRFVADGTGLGLSFAKAVIEKEGGSIALQSTENEGTVVTITLPIQPNP